MGGNHKTASGERFEESSSEDSSDYPKPKRMKEESTSSEEMTDVEDNRLTLRVSAPVSRIYPSLLTLTFCLEKMNIWRSNPLLLLKVETWTELYRNHADLTGADMAIHSTQDWSKILYSFFTSEQFVSLAWRAFAKNGIPNEQIVDFMKVVHEMRASGRLDDDFSKSGVFDIDDDMSSSLEDCEDNEYDSDSETEIISGSGSEATSVAKLFSDFEIETKSEQKIREELKDNRNCLLTIKQEFQVETVESSPTASPARNAEKYCRILTTNTRLPAPVRAFPKDSLSEDSNNESPEVLTMTPQYYSSCISSDDSSKKPKNVPKRKRSTCLDGLEEITVLPPRRSYYRGGVQEYLPKGPSSYPALTHEMLELVEKHSKRVTKTENPNVISKFTLTIKAKDLMAFKRGVWLQDVNLDFYLEMIQERNNAEGSSLPQVVIYHAFVHKIWENEKNFKYIEEHTDGVDIFKLNLAFCPVHAKNHWRLLVADIDQRTISCYDSVASNHNTGFMRSFKKIIEMERQKRFGDGAKYIKSWRLGMEPPKGIPRQQNGNDCGIFTLLYADYLSQKKPFDFKQSEILFFRHRMAYETATGEFLPTTVESK